MHNNSTKPNLMSSFFQGARLYNFRHAFSSNTLKCHVSAVQDDISAKTVPI